MMIRTAIAGLFGAAALLGSVACEPPKSDAPPAQPPQTTAGTTSTSSVAETFGALGAIHSAEVEHGMLAQKKANDPRVRSFAENVVNDHKTRMKKDEHLMSGLGITAKDSAVSEQIKAIGDRETSKLEELSGADFDRAYIEGQISYYRQVLDTFDRDLLPRVRDPAIKANVMDARKRASDHLKEAQDLRLSLIDAK